MTPADAVRTLQRFGEGIHPARLMDTDFPSHDDWHEAVGTICGIPWADYGWPRRHALHHDDCAHALGIPPHPEPGSGLEGHAEHSTEIMRAIQRRLTELEP
jgi:hypothetical protein